MPRFFRTVLLTGLFVGVADLIAAYVTYFIKNGGFASKMLQYIAGGALGLEVSMKGGFWIGLLGLLFHFFIAFSFTLFFFIIFPKLKLQRYNKYLVGILYAIFVNRTMALVVLPLTKLPPNKAPLDWVNLLITWAVLSLVLGIPIAISANRYYEKKRQKDLQNT